MNMEKNLHKAKEEQILLQQKTRKVITVVEIMVMLFWSARAESEFTWTKKARVTKNI